VFTNIHYIVITIYIQLPLMFKIVKIIPLKLSFNLTFQKKQNETDIKPIQKDTMKSKDKLPKSKFKSVFSVDDTHKEPKHIRQ